MAATENGNKQDERFRSAATGLALTLSLEGLIAGLQIAFAAPILEATEIGIDLSIDTWAVSAFRQQLAISHGKAALCLIGYWLLTAILGRGRLLEIRSANVTLGLAAAVWTLAIVIGSIVPDLHGFLKRACPLLDIPDTTPLYCFDCVSSCDFYVRSFMKWMVIGVPTILLAVSAILRIVRSRRQWRSNPACQI